MSRTMSEEDIANLSDEDIMNMAIAPGIPEEAQEPKDVQEQEQETHEEVSEHIESDAREDESDDGSSDDSRYEDGVETESSEEGTQDSEPAAGESNAEQEDNSKQNTKEVSKKDSGSEVDYKAFYERIMGPFKANGKDIQLKSIDEAIQLMQMGANYTKKLQALQPNLKMVKMLENNGLLDEGKLSYLIDISKKNPQAIQKLLRDSGIDPMEIDTSVEPTYRPSNHRVSDEEMVFTSTVEEVASDPVGKEMIVHINKTWDAKSKEALWTDPAILRVVTEQKQTGIYDQIVGEVERRRILGQLRNEPFLQVYHAVGREMQEQGLLVPRQQANGMGMHQPSRVVDVRPAQKKTVDTQTNEKARAASPVKVAPKKAVQDFNPLSMSDEEFEKSAELARRL
jgi:hypothetical protein